MLEISQEVEGLYYLCSDNKGADQLCGYRAVDLCLCFCVCKKQIFSLCCSFFFSLTFHSLPHPTHMSLVVRRCVFGVYSKVGFEPVHFATATCYSLEIFDM